ncbi:MAG TPA: hypothetical protein VHE30_21995 [Polyangiaceae bacterium]|nr:hypothetical protein [Polyangiaceae bacterium]
MASPTPSELKKELIAAGLEIFRVQGNRVHLADRVRENLIMDSGVAAVATDPLAVRLVLRAQASHFPGETPDQLFGRARGLAGGSVQRGYAETEATVVPIRDPGGGPGTLDTWYEVVFERVVSRADLVEELRYALSVEKAASTG